MSAAACKHVKSLRGSLTSLTHVTFNSHSATVISADLKNIQAQITALKSEPGLSSATSQLSASINQVQSAAKSAAASPSAAGFQSVVRALDALKTTAKPIIPQLKAACP